MIAGLESRPEQASGEDFADLGQVGREAPECDLPPRLDAGFYPLA